jgi:hypothetical protein
MAETIKGIQDGGVIACAKHYLLVGDHSHMTEQLLIRTERTRALPGFLFFECRRYNSARAVPLVGLEGLSS